MVPVIGMEDCDTCYILIALLEECYNAGLAEWYEMQRRLLMMMALTFDEIGCTIVCIRRNGVIVYDVAW